MYFRAAVSCRKMGAIGVFSSQVVEVYIHDPHHLPHHELRTKVRDEAFDFLASKGYECSHMPAFLAPWEEPSVKPTVK